MEKKYGFIKMTLAEFKDWLKEKKVANTIFRIQQHHTYIPNYGHFKGNNHFALQRSMRNTHVFDNGWRNIGQHFTTFPDGTIVTGRSMEQSPACIYGNNSNSICIEHLGDFDKERDQMNEAQKQTAIEMTAALCQRFNLEVNSNTIVYHHWFKLSTGERNNGKGGNKSCPGTNFFGGNKVVDCETNFIPKVVQVIDPNFVIPAPPVLKYASVTADFLNVRQGPRARFPKTSERDPIALGGIIRVFDEKNKWLKISSTKEHWVSGRYTKEVRKAVVDVDPDDVLNIRTGPSSRFDKVGSLNPKEEVFVEMEEENKWCQLVMREEWISKRFLDFDV